MCENTCVWQWTFADIYIYMKTKYGHTDGGWYSGFVIVEAVEAETAASAYISITSIAVAATVAVLLQ